MSLSKPVRDQQPPGKPPARTSREPEPDMEALLEKLRDDEELVQLALKQQKLKSKYLAERRQKLERFLQAHKQEVDIKVVAMQTAEKERRVKEERDDREHLELDERRERLEEEKAQLLQRREELRREVHKHCMYRDMMEECRALAKLQIGEFRDAQAFADYAQTQLEMRDKLYETWLEKQEMADTLRRQKAKLDDAFDLMLLRGNNEARQLDEETERIHAEATYWQKKWDEIEKAATDKEREIGQIKMATLNMYEMTGGELGGKDGVDLHDTDGQLGKIMTHILDLQDILDWHEVSLKTGDDGEKSEAAAAAEKRKKKKKTTKGKAKSCSVTCPKKK